MSPSGWAVLEHARSSRSPSKAPTPELHTGPPQECADQPTTYSPDRGADRPAAGSTGRLPTLPVVFWNARPSLAHVRQAAHARSVSADVVLHVLLARLASMQHPDTRVDTGVLSPASLNIITSPVGASGAGKTAGVRVARDLFSAPESVTMNDGYRDGVPLGSGEGVAELFMGDVLRDTGEVKRDGTPKVERVRAQVRHNALVHADEGEALLRIMGRQGATIGPALRSAWVGETLGQSNASRETTRVVCAGSYALGVVIGFQVDTVGPLFADSAGGTPQRFLFCSASDATIPDEAPDWPGPLDSVAPTGVGPDRTIPVVDHDVRRAVRAEHLARQRGERTDDDPLDAHAPLHRAKVAALLAILDGRREVTGDDWRLADVVWRTSVRVRTALVERGRALHREQGEARVVAHAEREERAEIARGQAAGRVERIARRLALRVHDEGAAKLWALSKTLNSRDRPLFDYARDHARDRGWLTVADEWVYPGAVGPP